MSGSNHKKPPYKSIPGVTKAPLSAAQVDEMAVDLMAGHDIHYTMGCLEAIFDESGRFLRVRIHGNRNEILLTFDERRIGIARNVLAILSAVCAHQTKKILDEQAQHHSDINELD